MDGLMITTSAGVQNWNATVSSNFTDDTISSATYRVNQDLSTLDTLDTRSALYGVWLFSVLNSVTTTSSPSPVTDITIITPSRPFMTTAVASFQVLQSVANYQTSVAVWRYCPPFLLFLGTLGNVLTVWVLTFIPMDTTSTIPIYFRALALSDLCLLYSGLLRNWIKYSFHLEIRDSHSLVCKIHIWLVYVTGMTSAWFLVAMTTQRALLVVWPHKVRVVSNRRMASIIVAVIVILSCLLNAHNLYGYDLVYYPSYGQYYCDYLNSNYESWARGTWPWIDMTMISLLPFCFLIVNNSLLMWKVASSVREVRKLTCTRQNSQDAVSQRKKMSTSLNLTLVSVSAMYLLLTSPICVYLILDHYFRFDLMGNGNLELTATANLAWAVTNNLWYTNSSINFYLYCLSGSRFRQQVWSCLCFFHTKRDTTAKGLNTVAGSLANR